MQRLARIEKLLRSQLAPSYFELQDESHQHSVPEGAESHFKLLIVDSRFTGMSRAQAHQLVYKVLQAELASGLHALSLKCMGPEEWEKSKITGLGFQSPQCHSKS